MKIDRVQAMRDQKRIAILLPNLGGGGAERVALTLAEHFIAEGHAVDLVLAKAEGVLLPLVPAGVRIVDLKAHRLLAALPPLVRYLRAERPDALHAHMWPLTIVAIMAHKVARSAARLIVSGHTFLSRHLTGRRQAFQLRWTVRLFYPLADVRTMCSNAAADDLARLSGLSRDRIEVVHNPITPPERIATNAEAEASWRGPGPRIITVGTLKAVKNHALLLDAFARLSRKDAQLMILGEGDLRSQLEQHAKTLGIADRVAMPGFATDPWPYYASADLFVLSSDYEGFPLVLVEAMHAGLKVVSTDCLSGPAEILEAGRFGRLVPCGNEQELARAMDAAITDQIDSKSMRARASQLAGAGALSRYSDVLIGNSWAEL